MYRYDSFDQTFIDERVAHYRDQTRRYLAGELSEEQFLQLRLRNGLYIQRLAPMLRVAIPYGTLSSRQLRMLAHIARHYDRGYGHLSTRQNIQFNWPALEEVPDILADLAKVQMHAIQTSGNCIRNVTTDEFAGVAADEEIDARPYCELIRQWSTSHPEFDWLPRKFKIAVTGAPVDRAAINVHDIGIRAYPAPGRRSGTDGEDLFDIKVGGGLGRTPVIGALIREGLPARHLLTYLEAIMRVYNRYGRRDNKYKARIKILVRAMTPEGFKSRVDEEWSHLENSASTLTPAEIARMRAHFRPPDYPLREGAAETLAADRLRDPSFDRWVRLNVSAHKQPGYAIVTLSCKPTGVPPGDVDDRQMEAVAGWAEAYGFGEVRISHQQNFVLPDVAANALHDLWRSARVLGLGTANRNLATDIICCPGRRLLLTGQCQVDSGRGGHSATSRRPGLPPRSRRDRHQHIRLHERLRPPPRGSYRHSRGRQERPRVLPDLSRRPLRRRRIAGQNCRALGIPGRSHRRHPGHPGHLPRASHRGRELSPLRPTARTGTLQGAHLCQSCLA